METLRAVILSNGIEGLPLLYRDRDKITYDTLEVEKNFQPDFTGYDLLLVPNGSDHVAMFRIRDQVKTFLDQGGTVFCFDGWFTDWVPGNRWIMDNSKKTIDTRYYIKDDPGKISEHFSVDDLTFSHGISGWWACGYIEPAPGATVLLEDTWGRPLIVIDEQTTPGLMILTASGPVGDASYATTDDDHSRRVMTDMYQAFLQLVQSRKPPCNET